VSRARGLDDGLPVFRAAGPEVLSLEDQGSIDDSTGDLREPEVLTLGGVAEATGCVLDGLRVGVCEGSRGVLDDDAGAGDRPKVLFRALSLATRASLQDPVRGDSGE
jgi:hypothetical protein